VGRDTSRTSFMAITLKTSSHALCHAFLGTPRHGGVRGASAAQ
jgi:hypothetical protein